MHVSLVNPHGDRDEETIHVDMDNNSTASMCNGAVSGNDISHIAIGKGRGGHNVPAVRVSARHRDLVGASQSTQSTVPPEILQVGGVHFLSP